ncbi:MAG: hypothetical protein WBM52_09895 [Thiogranum sp.]
MDDKFELTMGNLNGLGAHTGLYHWAFHLLVIAWAGWLNRHQQAVTGCFIEGSRVLKDKFEGQWLGFTDKQRQ